ncbi:hypothetical protein CUN60_02775 [Aquella oligotrophica]|uniref:Uncharacterized protein n=1 Tax=Aquella oligotrophica TaxID=2067065 RepID=A0A2I7N467_9NEIS|nr:hypothetical protein CUN60_02775 [Aquella oligotrophica]
MKLFGKVRTKLFSLVLPVLVIVSCLEAVSFAVVTKKSSSGFNMAVNPVAGTGVGVGVGVGAGVGVGVGVGLGVGVGFTF